MQVLFVAILLVLAIELWGIWTELGRIRKEQVKNKLYGLPESTLTRIESRRNKELIKRRFEATVFVEGTVQVDNWP